MEQATATTTNNNGIVKYDEKVALEKGENWRRFGINVYKKELQLQAKAQQIISTIPAPKKIEDLPEFEKKLAQAKADLKELKEGRIKDITQRFDEVCARLMGPEKSIESHIKSLEPTLISLKKDYQTKRQEEQNKTNELKRVREDMIFYASEQLARLKQQQVEWLTNGYTYALDNVQLSGLQQFLTTLKARTTVVNRTIPLFKATAIYNKQEEVDKIIEEEFKQEESPEDLVKNFHDAIDEKFSDFEIALKNKTKAIEVNQQELASYTTEIESSKRQSQAAAAFIASAQSSMTVEQAGVKELKRVYKLEMEEDEANAVLIMSAFVSNLQRCMKTLRLSKWFNLSVKQMIQALEKVKSEDNKFQYTGLNFVETDKL